MKFKLLILSAFFPILANAQSFEYDMTKEQPVYSDALGYGYDIIPAQAKNNNKPFYF